MDKLKPCPWCAGKATVRYEKNMKMYVGICLTCLATCGYKGKREDAINAWNRRVSDGN